MTFTPIARQALACADAATLEGTEAIQELSELLSAFAYRHLFVVVVGDDAEKGKRGTS